VVFLRRKLFSDGDADVCHTDGTENVLQPVGRREGKKRSNLERAGRRNRNPKRKESPVTRRLPYYIIRGVRCLSPSGESASFLSPCPSFANYTGTWMFSITYGSNDASTPNWICHEVGVNFPYFRFYPLNVYEPSLNRFLENRRKNKSPESRSQ